MNLNEQFKARAKLAQKEAEAAYWKGLATRAKNCSHLREDGTSVIAWAVQSDGITRGVCQHCTTSFSPRREECIDDYVFSVYETVRKIPYRKSTEDYRTTPGGVILESPVSLITPSPWREKVLNWINFLLYLWVDRNLKKNVRYFSGLSVADMRMVFRMPDVPAILRMNPLKFETLVTEAHDAAIKAKRSAMNDLLVPEDHYLRNPLN